MAMTPRRALLGAALAAPFLPGLARAAAPFRGGQVPGWYRFRLGGFECTVVSDGALNLAPAHPTFGGSVASEADVHGALREAFLPTDRVAAQLNCLVVNTGRQIVLLDCGVGPQPVFGPGSGRLGTALAAAGIAPAEVDIVAFTHAHADHCWGVVDGAGRDVFPNARFVMTQADFEFWTSEQNLSLPEPLRSLVAGTRTALLPRRDRFTMAAPNAEVAPGIRFVPAAGHTAGHVAVNLESEGRRLLVMGDISNHHVLALRYPDWPFAFDMDPMQASVTRRRVLEMATIDRVQVLGYHFPWPGLGHVDRFEGAYAFVQSPWEWG